MIPFTRRTFFVLALAGSASSSGAVRAADLQTVSTPVIALDNGLLAVMKAGKATPFNQRYAMLAPIVQRAFDLPQVLQVSVGASWSTFSTQQQGVLLDEFARYTVANYVANFNSYNGQRFDVSPSLRQVGADQIVQTTLVSPSEQTRLDYVVRNLGGTWKIVDVLLDGTISRVAVQRSDFREVVRSGGAPGLVTLLQRKVAELSGGAMT